ncbi:MAG: carboxypeptidase-like regulatory domain-containing protein [Bacillota bacterium]|nr:carboxypeptidase-like regulatory domain-containing protein [Bacillota bacterium]
MDDKWNTARSGRRKGMVLRMRCLSRKEIVDYAFAPQEGATASRCAAHLATGCARCNRELRAIKALAAALGEDDVWEEVPEHVLQKAFAIFPCGAGAQARAGAEAGAEAKTETEAVTHAEEDAGVAPEADARRPAARPGPHRPARARPIAKDHAAERLRVPGPGFLVPQPATRSADSARLPSGGTVQVSVRGRDVRGQVFDAAHEDLSGMVVALLDARDAQVARTATDALGRFAFKGLKPGTYNVVVTNHKGDARCRVEIEGR